MLKDSYLDYVIDSLSFCAKEISYRKMFGGYGIYYHGVMMGLLAKNELYFKVDDSNRDKYEERKSVPFTYEKKDKTVTMSYWKLPEEILEDPSELKVWLDMSYNIVKNNLSSRE